MGIQRKTLAGLHRGIVLALLATTCMSAQQTELTAKLRLAQNFEQAGEWERAATLYESLHGVDPENYVFFDGLRRCYTQLKQYEKAMRLIRERLTVQPRDEGLLSMLGGLHYQAGEQQTADSLWQIVLAKDPQNVNLYRLVASQMIEHRQYDQAIEIYRRARRVMGSQEVFMEELAALYSALQQYELTTAEYVKMLRQRPQQLPYIEARLSSFAGKEQGLRAALNIVQEEVQRQPGEIPMHSLLAWLLMEKRDFESALAEYRMIDDLSKAQGSELFQFAERALREKAYWAAAKAFREAEGHQAPQPLRLQARFGYARAIEELSAANDSSVSKHIPISESPTAKPDVSPASETRPSFQGAIRLYESLVSEYPNSEIAMQSLYRIGVIRYQRFFDLDGAALAFDRVRTMPFNGALVREATVDLGELRLVQNNLAQSRLEYRQLLTAPADAFRDRALYHLAELDYFEAAFDSAMTTLQAISANASTDLTNDALQLLYFIQENKTSTPAALAGFAKADLMMRQRKYAEALGRFQDLTHQHPTALLVDDATMRCGELYLLLNRVQEALKIFQRLVRDAPSSILGDKAQMRIGELYENRLNDKQRAIEAYEQVLINFPKSFYANEARRRIRLLRGDTP